ncbi:hypothetical protein SUDANB28_06495 [Streptomyces sp. enrichment culture]
MRGRRRRQQHQVRAPDAGRRPRRRGRRRGRGGQVFLHHGAGHLPAVGGHLDAGGARKAASVGVRGPPPGRPGPVRGQAHTVAHLQHGGGQRGDPGGRPGVPGARRGAPAGLLDVWGPGCALPSGRVRGAVRGGEPAVGVLEYGVDAVAVGERPGQRFEHDRSHALSRPVPGAGGVEQQFDAAGDGCRALAPAQCSHGEVDGGQGGALGGVDGLGGPGQREQSGRRRRQPRMAAGRCAEVVVPDRRREQCVVAGADAGEHADRAGGACGGRQRVQAGPGAARVLQGLPHHLREQTFLRVRRDGLGCGDTEEVGVEVGGPVHEVAALARCQRIAAGPAGRAGCRGVAARAQVLPVGVHVTRRRIAAGDTDDGVPVVRPRLPAGGRGRPGAGVTGPAADMTGRRGRRSTRRGRGGRGSRGSRGHRAGRGQQVRRGGGGWGVRRVGAGHGRRPGGAGRRGQQAHGLLTLERSGLEAGEDLAFVHHTGTGLVQSRRGSSATASSTDSRPSCTASSSASRSMPCCAGGGADAAAMWAAIAARSGWS